MSLPSTAKRTPRAFQTPCDVHRSVMCDCLIAPATRDLALSEHLSRGRSLQSESAATSMWTPTCRKSSTQADSLVDYPQRVWTSYQITGQGVPNTHTRCIVVHGYRVQESAGVDGARSCWKQGMGRQARDPVESGCKRDWPSGVPTASHRSNCASHASASRVHGEDQCADAVHCVD